MVEREEKEYKKKKEMDIEATSSSCCSEHLNFIIHETIVFHHNTTPIPITSNYTSPATTAAQPHNIPENTKKKTRKKSKICSNKEEAETQRMTHIVVERNRRKQMNQHLTVLRSLLPQSYIRRVSSFSSINNMFKSLYSQKFTKVNFLKMIVTYEMYQLNLLAVFIDSQLFYKSYVDRYSITILL